MAGSIAFKIDEELFREIHIRAAQKGFSTQQYVTSLIERDLFPERFPQPSEEQIEQLREAVRELNKNICQITDLLTESPEQESGWGSMKLGG